MTEPQRKDRNELMLAECYKTFGKRVRDVIESLEDEGFRPRIQCAWRSPADQLDAFKSGHSKLRYGYHNVTRADGKPEALAVDILEDGKPLDPPRRYLLALAAYADQFELRTGIGWGLPASVANGLLRALMTGDRGYTGKIGWDPCHLETTFVTVAEAKAGKRP